MTRLRNRRSSLPLLLVLLIGLALTSAAADDSRPGLTVLDEKVWLYQPPVPGSNSLIVEQENGLLVVGAQHSPQAAATMLKMIATVTKASVRHLVLQHPQAIVAGGASAFPDGTLIIASSWALTDLNDKEFDFGGELRALAGDSSWVAPPRPTPGLALEAQATLTDPLRPAILIPYPDHFTKGDLLVKLPSQSILVAGGLLFPDQTPFVGDANVSRMIATLSFMARERDVRFVPLRGELMDASQVRKQRDRLNWIHGRLESGLSTTDTPEVITSKLMTEEKLANYFAIDDPLLPLLIESILEQSAERRRKFTDR